MQVTVLVFIGGPVAVLLLGVLVLAIAISLSGDLEPVKAQARADGLQTDWSDPRWGTNAEHTAAAAEIVALASGIVFHPGTHRHSFSMTYFDQTSQRTILLGQPGSDIPAELRDHYGAEPPPWLIAFTTWRQRYVERPLRFPRPPDPLGWETTKSLQSIIDWLSYRILLSDEASPEAVLTLLDANDLQPFDMGWQATRRWEKLVRVATLLHLRRDDWGHHRDLMIEALQERRGRMADEYRYSLHGQFIHVCETIGRDPHDVAKDLGIAVPGWFEFATGSRIVHRIGRVDVLDRQRALTVDLLASSDLMSNVLQTPTGHVRGSGRVDIWYPAGMLDAVFSYEQRAWITWMSYHKFGLWVDLAIADLTGKPWPPDSMEPARASLTPWNERGVVVGAISVGLDGLPGTQDDWRLRLRDPPLPAPAAVVAPSLPTAAPTPHPRP